MKKPTTIKVKGVLLQANTPSQNFVFDVFTEKSLKDIVKKNKIKGVTLNHKEGTVEIKTDIPFNPKVAMALEGIKDSKGGFSLTGVSFVMRPKI
jgi:hypothetical protein